MCKKLSLLALVSLLLLVDLPLVSAHNVDLNPNNPNIWGAPDPTTMVIDSPFEPATLDPAYAYDEVSQEVIMNVYEPLLFFDRDYTLGPYDAGKVDQFVPKLATSWTEQTISETSPEGLLWVKRWAFTIRTEVKFQDGSYLTPEDVEYSFERLLVQDRSGGPAWTLYEPLLGAYRAAEPGVIPDWGLRIDHAVESNNNTVWFNLVSNFPSVMFKQIVSQTWSGVVERAWAHIKGDLDVDDVPGGWSNWEYIWNYDGPDAGTAPDWHDPPVSKLDDIMMGTGPYTLALWNQGSSLALVRFADYWDGWPAWKSEARTERIGGYISTVIWNYRTEWADRRPRFLMETTDTTYVDRPYRDQVLGQPGIRSLYRSGFLSLSLGAFFFNFNISTPPGGYNPYIPTVYPPDTFGPDGIPPNIFSDVNVRRGFAYAFDYPAYLTSMYFGEGEIPSDPVIKGLPYDNPAQEGYSLNATIARYYLRLAWGGIDHAPLGPPWGANDDSGALWNNGMRFSIAYPAGNVVLEQAAMMLRNNINGLGNTRFHVDTIALQWHYFASGVYLAKMPLFALGYQGDFPDPHDFVYDFMYSQGTLASFQSYDNLVADGMIEDGILTPDGPQRQQIYYDLQAIYHNDVPSVPFAQPVGREFERDWMRGWYNNPITPGRYIYHRWKALTHLGDANNDGLVDVADFGVISAHWSGPPSGSMGYAPQADLSGGIGGTTGSQSGPVPGIPDGTINIIDISMVSAYYDGPPVGSLHP